MTSDAQTLQMPSAFGVACGPRSLRPEALASSGPIHSARWNIKYRTTRECAQALLPRGVHVFGEPEIVFEIAKLSNVAWLAGRGYNILSVRVPARFEGSAGLTIGACVAVAWENRTEPIITGREQLGWPKIYGDISIDDVSDRLMTAAAEWDSHRFFSMKVHRQEELLGQELKSFRRSIAPGEGYLMHKLIARTGDGWVKTDANYVTLAPLPSKENLSKGADGSFRIWRCDGEASWTRATWQQMPTQFHIVNALADCKILDCVASWYVEGLDFNTQIDQRILAV
jgi:hypothetical protein